jgi:Na+-transporting methylmalonyl-CoA/oxaloacetate decarboxylase gamma subunit
MELWRKTWIDFWRDPRNVRDFLLSQQFILIVFALGWGATLIFGLVGVVLPTQQKSWSLWLPPEDAQLARDTAIVVTFGSFFVVMMVQAAMRKSARWIGGIGIVLAVLFLAFSLIGAFNYYSHANERTSGASVASGQNATSAVADAEAALALHDAETKAALDRIDAQNKQALDAIDAQIKLVPANYPTGMSRLVRQRTAAAETSERTRAETSRLADLKRADLLAALERARNTSVDTIVNKSDTRPVDGFVSRLTGVERRDVSNFMDAARSGLFELLIIIGAPLFTIALFHAMELKVEKRSPDQQKTQDKPPPKTERKPRNNQTRVRPATEEELAAWELGLDKPQDNNNQGGND